MDEFTGYVPKVGDRVRILPREPEDGPTLFAGMVGTVRTVAPALSSCHVWLDELEDAANRRMGYPGVRFFPGEIEKIEE
jgi:hypothetical protein